MKKEDILKKAQEENNDEMENAVHDKSALWAFIVMGLCIVVISFIKQERGEHTSDLTFTVALGASVCNFYRYAKLKNGKSLFAGIITAIGAVACLIFFIMGH